MCEDTYVCSISNIWVETSWKCHICWYIHIGGMESVSITKITLVERRGPFLSKEQTHGEAVNLSFLLSSPSPRATSILFTNFSHFLSGTDRKTYFPKWIGLSDRLSYFRTSFPVSVMIQLPPRILENQSLLLYLICCNEARMIFEDRMYVLGNKQTICRYLWIFLGIIYNTYMLRQWFSVSFIYSSSFAQC